MVFPPNWKDPHAYPDPRSIPPPQMAWEFLRRNPRYQQDYQEYAQRLGALLKDYPEGLKNKADWSSLLNDPRANIYEPPKRFDETESAWIRRVGQGTVTPINVWYARRWGIRRNPPDPSKDCPRNLLLIFWVRSPGMVRRLTPFGSEEYLAGQGGKVALGFDLSVPVVDQIKEAERFLTARKRQLRHKGDPAVPAVDRRPSRGARLVTLLRVLDATGVHASISEIGKELFPKTPNSYPDRNRDHVVRSTIKAAIAMRDGGYLDLLMAR